MKKSPTTTIFMIILFLALGAIAVISNASDGFFVTDVIVVSLGTILVMVVYFLDPISKINLSQRAMKTITFTGFVVFGLILVAQHTSLLRDLLGGFYFVPIYMGWMFLMFIEPVRSQVIKLSNR